jgi:hypothetical protein
MEKTCIRNPGCPSGIIFPRAEKQFFSGLKILQFFDADPGSGIEKFGPRLRDKHPGFATLR